MKLYNKLFRSTGDFLRSIVVSRSKTLPLKNVKNIGRGKHFFLIGSAPSVNLLDLKNLYDSGVDFGCVNLSYRCLGENKKIPYHFVSDEDCYNNYAAEFEFLDVGMKFYRASFRDKDAISVSYRKGGILKRGFQENVEYGIGNDSNVMLFAIQILYYLGYDVVNVIGCDLDYSQSKKYAYDMCDKDSIHELHDSTSVKRKAMKNANSEFLEAGRVYSQDSRMIRNCSPVGNLNSIPRCEYKVALEEAIKAMLKV
ncbi:hypothetical protein LH51_07665 [Nitrincola sp. A-D6]|uniref:hypothetical protein n=1 Tax=Nitrincola sp. A-D6 TaxID=1545442 RepID=UPI00051FB3B6|nr:hypothetical protein [Nitrincola sp. A-D6]KGK42388.1 hypothetical protein LH51_07665 [Nitrincola sp. A-D6]